MKLKALVMLRIDKVIVNPGESFESPKSQALLLIKGGLAVILDKKSAKEQTVSCTRCGEEVPLSKVEHHDKVCTGNELESYEELTVKELREECETRGIEIPKGSRKDELISLLEANDNEEGA